jgi:hypothetical protein
MANYLKGIGDAATRVNEILPSLDAKINSFLVGHTAGIIKGEFYEFAATAIDRGVVVKSGLFEAYGYFGATDTETQINFIMPSGTNYVHLYAEIDLSVVPNRFEIKATPMSNSSAFSFRQDNLRTNLGGKYQFPLWQVTLTASSIILTDRRAYIAKPSDAVTAENFTAAGGIATRFAGVDAAVALKAPIASPTFTGTPTVNIDTAPTTQTQVVNLAGNGANQVVQHGNIDPGWYRIYLGGGGGGNGGANNNGAGGSGGSGGVVDVKILIPYRTAYYTGAGGGGASATNYGGSPSGGGGGGGSSVFAIPQLGILLCAFGGGGGGGRSWSGGRGSTGGSGGMGGGYGGGTAGGSSTGNTSVAGGANGAGYPTRLSSDYRASGGGVAANGGNGGNNINLNEGDGAGVSGNGWVRVYRLT